MQNRDSNINEMNQLYKSITQSLGEVGADEYNTVKI